MQQAIESGGKEAKLAWRYTNWIDLAREGKRIICTLECFLSLSLSIGLVQGACFISSCIDCKVIFPVAICFIDFLASRPWNEKGVNLRLICEKNTRTMPYSKPSKSLVMNPRKVHYILSQIDTFNNRYWEGRLYLQ